ncbi:DEKNAAC105142 [Brettanomyces naardenensis]|uniref:DEKNAAC105142 n=1 Tax=Brettanomyces naardenensis TaxID=13370 RepID=A0A448YSS7_BRENA|nr:DEKNAAC105142 [Brettanomyces naardenensis]
MTAHSATLKSASQIIESASTKYDHLKPIIWVDCEMTGLDHVNDHIIEICCLVTDKNLKILDQNGYESVIHYPKSVMDQMNGWCIQHHGDSGLTKKVISSKKTLPQVEEELLTYIKGFVSPKIGILAGNSIHMDRLFMLKEMPKVIDYLTYRLIDVSTIMEISKRHNPKVQGLMPPKIGAHTAKQDIIESINQLKFYRDVYFKSAEEINGDEVKERWRGKDINGNELSEERGKKKRRV